MFTPHERSRSAIYVYVCARDADLRAWLIDELMLITWLGRVEIRAIDSLRDELFRTNELDLLLIELDGLDPADAELLVGRRWSQPVIGVGEAVDSLASSVACVLDRSPTSMRLKKAIRVLLAARPSTPQFGAGTVAPEPSDGAPSGGGG
jgi:hypothetical protein